MMIWTFSNFFWGPPYCKIIFMLNIWKIRTFSRWNGVPYFQTKLCRFFGPVGGKESQIQEMGRDCSRSLHIQAWHLWSTKVPSSKVMAKFGFQISPNLGLWSFFHPQVLKAGTDRRLSLHCLVDTMGLPFFSLFLKFISNIFRSQYVDTSWYIMINPCKSATCSLNPATFEYLYRCGRFFHIPWRGSRSQHIWHGQSLMLTLKHFSSSWLLQISRFGAKRSNKSSAQSNFRKFSFVKTIKILDRIQCIIMIFAAKHGRFMPERAWWVVQNPDKKLIDPMAIPFIPSSSPTWRAGKSTIFLDDSPTRTSIYRGFPIATFDFPMVIG